MNRWKLLSMTASVFCAALLFAGCGGEGTEGSSCTFDTDCGALEVCVATGSGNQCATACGGDVGDVCPNGSMCQSVPTPTDGTVQACVTTSMPADAGDAGDTGVGDSGVGDSGMDGGMNTCDEDLDCNPPQTVCDTDQNVCVPAIRYMQVTEVTKRENPANADQACGQSVEDPGADMLSLQLLDSGGSTIGYADVLSANDHSVTADTIFDGDATDATPRGDNNELCAPTGEFDSSAVVLGCRDGSEIGNGLVVQFRPTGDASGAPLTIKPGMQLFAAEHGPFCCTTQQCRDNSVDEYYELKLCSATTSSTVENASQNQDGDFPSCDTMGLVSATGETTYTVKAEDLPSTSN